MWLFKKQPLSFFIAGKLDGKIKQTWFHELLECNLCLGVWAYLVLNWIFNFTIIFIGIPFLEYLITGCVMSFIGYLLSKGWESQFTNIIIGS